MITGANGFIGSYLHQYFREVGHQVFACSRDKLDLLDGKAVDQFFNGSTYFDLVIHTALVGRENLYELKEGMNQQIVVDNLRMWDHLVRNRHRFKRLICFGSGNEFDTDIDIDMVDENTIFERDPKYTYGAVKNMISRDMVQYEEFYNLRLFGVFHYTESPKRFFKKIQASSRQDYHIYQDRLFDFINLEDITPMIEIVMEGKCQHRDINMVYRDKYKLSEMANTFNEIAGCQTKIIIDDPEGNTYTGDYSRFYSYNTPKMGLHLGFLRY